jgi:hypothetical protein
MNILDSPAISSTRRNHGLEHATIHLLSRRYPGKFFAGHSDSGGFWLIGDVGTEELADIVSEALTRLQNGETNLALHPNCGTNFVTYGLFAGMGAFIALLGARRTRDKLDRFPLVVLLATLGFILGQPAAYNLQKKITTSGVPGNLKVLQIIRSQAGQVVSHRVTTQG